MYEVSEEDFKAYLELLHGFLERFEIVYNEEFEYDSQKKFFTIIEDILIVDYSLRF